MTGNTDTAVPQTVAVRNLIIEILEQSPGLSRRAIREMTREVMPGMEKNSLCNAIRVLKQEKAIRVQPGESERDTRYYVSDGKPVVVRVPASVAPRAPGRHRSISPMRWTALQLVGVV